MKKSIHILLALVLILAFAAPLTAYADDTVYSHDCLLYRIEDGGAVICGYIGIEEESVVVPNILSACPVSAVAAGAFSEPGALKTIYLPDTIMEIEEGAIPAGIQVVRDYNLANGTGQNTEQTASQTEAQTGASAQEPANTAQQSTSPESATQPTQPTQQIDESLSNNNVVVTNETFHNQNVEADMDDEPQTAAAGSSQAPAAPAQTVPETPDPSVDVNAHQDVSETAPAAPEASTAPAAPGASDAPAATDAPVEETKSGSTGLIVVAAVLVCGGAAAYAMSKKKKGGAEK